MDAQSSSVSKHRKSITEFWTKIPTLQVEGLCPGLGGELELGRDGLQPPDLPLKVQIRVERSKERKQNQQSQIVSYFKPKVTRAQLLRKQLSGIVPK